MHKIELGTLPVSHSIGAINLTLKYEKPFYVLIADGFDSEDIAKHFSNALWAGLMWAVVSNYIGVNMLMKFEKITYAPDSGMVGFDGLVDIQFMCTYPSGKIIGAKSLTGEVSHRIGGERYLSVISEGINSNYSKLIEDNKLKLALELFSNSFYEETIRAKFILMVMVLEVLTEDFPKHSVAKGLLDNWAVEIDNEIKRFAIDSEEHEALQALKHELFFRKEASFRSKVRKLVIDTMRAAKIGNAEDYAKKAVKIYDRRSTLVHTGNIPDDELRKSYSLSKEIAQIILKAKIERYSNFSEDK